MLLAVIVAPATVSARSSDRNKDMDIDAGNAVYSLDDSQPTVLTEGVTITQGTLDIRANRADITQRGGEPVRVVLTGAPAKLNQQLDDGTPMSATATKVDYDLTTEIVIFTGNVRIQQPRGSLSGQRVVYNMRTGQVQSGGKDSGRVKMRILPRNAQGGG
ncbi:lipopolysaccharide transport periplasmic protein LptA [Lysobacter korlensis]|uniref:Lipopolysaccharide export system protein LptA n=1 Tax=Lysobacter korlensis TaxID=553636 RepID=A0ABV6RQV4_9GAMM